MTAVISNGTTIGVGDGAAPEVFSSLGEVTGISGPGQSAPVADTTHLSSAARTFLRGIEDGGEVTIECNLDTSDTPQTTARTSFTAGTLKNWKITFPNSATCSFSAGVIGHDIAVAIDQQLKLTLKLKVSGNTTWA